MMFSRSIPFTGGGGSLARLASRLLVVSLLACTGVVLATSAAGAQTSPPSEPPVTLVSNLDLGAGTETANLASDHGQAFTTGRHHHGYVVSSMTLKLVATPGFDPESVRLSIWSTRYWDGHPRPDDELAVLATPYADSEGYWVFTAPAGGIHLDPSTRYVLVLDSESSQGGEYVANIQSNDQSGQPEWQIYDSKIYKGAETGNTGWANYSHSLGVKIDGREAPVRHTQLEAHIGPGDDPVPHVICVFRGWGVPTEPCRVAE